MEIWVDPACSKCRSATAALDEAGVDLPTDAAHRHDWLAAMVAHPIVIQRPILTADDGTTVVGRDPDALARAVAAGRA